MVHIIDEPFHQKDKEETTLTLEDLMDGERLEHAKLEKEINKVIDAEILKYIDHPILGLQMKKPYFSRPSNPSLYFIIPNELAERFCYYGFVPLMKNMFGKALGYSKYTYGADGKLSGEVDNTIPNYYRLNFDVATYCTPLFGAFVSDSYLDKYKTILSLGLFYLVGIYMLFFATNPNIMGVDAVFAPIMQADALNQTVLDSGIGFLGAEPYVSSIPRTPVFIALGLIAFGTGGIKPCVSAHGGDQFLDQQVFGLNQFYSFFYMAINVGAMVSSYVVPEIKKQSCFGAKEDCYSYAYLVCAIVFTIAYIVFGIGKRYYRVVPPAGRFVVFDLIAVAWSRMTKGVDVTRAVYGNSLLVEAADFGKVILAILPTPIFWMGFNQNGSTWQDSTDRLGKSIFTSEQINAVLNPILIVILTPIFATQIYPRISKKFNLLQRVCLGYFFAAASFVLCALIEDHVTVRCKIDNTLATDDYYFGKCAYPELDNMIWFFPYFLITIAEVLVSISGINFVYQEVGKRTKSSSTSMWLLTSCIGSLIAAQLTKRLSPAQIITDDHPVTYVQFYYICAGIIAAAIIPQGIITYFYTYKVDRHDSKQG
jgi:dipeptide/tripeptide permease